MKVEYTQMYMNRYMICFLINTNIKTQHAYKTIFIGIQQFLSNCEHVLAELS